MPFTHEQLRPFVDAKWITAQRHPSLPLTIYNYSKRCQYDRHWTPETMAARGLVLDDDNNVIVRPFPKFFNRGETDESTPDGPYSVYEKLDGSLFLVGRYEGELITATRGSFTGQQATLGRSLVSGTEYDYAFKDGLTYVFELIHPDNRIVVDYGNRSEVVLLTIIESATGCEFSAPMGFPFPELLPIDPATMDAMLADPQQQVNREGFVIHYHRGGRREKIKFDEYVRLHKIVTGIHARHIWERLSSGQSLDEILERVPDEFYDWVKQTERELREEFIRSRETQQYFFDRVYREAGSTWDRKAFAQAAAAIRQLEPDIDLSVMFRLLDSKPVDDLIWKAIRPTATRPFREEEAA